MLEVAYILLRFPYLTETFVADEIIEMQRQGVKVRIISLLSPHDTLVQPTSQQLLGHTTYAPDARSWRLWKAQLYFVLRSPLLYGSLLLQLIRQPYLPGKFGVSLSRRLLIFLKAVTIARQLKDSPVQFLHSHFAWLSGAAAAIISKLINAPFTVTVHAYDIYISNDLLCFTTRSAAGVVAISRYNQTMVQQQCPGLPDDRFTVIHCGIDPHTFIPAADTPSHTPLSILSVGSLTPKKGHQHLIEACGQLHAQGVDFNCVIIGSGPAENHTYLQQRVQQLGLTDRITLTGALPREEVLAAFRRCDMFVLASIIAKEGDRDGIPVVLMEALAMGIPVISTNVSGIPELVRPGETGLLVPPGDPAALTQAIIQLAAAPDLQATFKQNGRQLVEEQFQIQGNVQRLKDLFQRLAGAVNTGN